MTAPSQPHRRPQPDRLSPAEIRKDSVQGAVEAVAGTVGEVTSILTRAVQDVTKAVGGLATELFEIRDSARKASCEYADECTGERADENLDEAPDPPGAP